MIRICQQNFITMNTKIGANWFIILSILKAPSMIVDFQLTIKLNQYGHTRTLTNGALWEFFFFVERGLLSEDKINHTLTLFPVHVSQMISFPSKAPETRCLQLKTWNKMASILVPIPVILPIVDWEMHTVDFGYVSLKNAFGPKPNSRHSLLNATYFF